MTTTEAAHLVHHPDYELLLARYVHHRFGLHTHDCFVLAVVEEEDGGMPDAVPPVDLASLAAGGGHPGARWRLDGEDLQSNLVRLDQGDRIQPHRNDELEVLVVVVAGRSELTLDGQVHQLAPMVAHLPKGTVRAIQAVDGPLAYLSVHRRRSAGLQVGWPAQQR